jgi:uncharacterized Zn finger protein
MSYGRYFFALYGKALLDRAAAQGWWCPSCARWKTQDEVRQAERDEVCVEVCTTCGTIAEDRRAETNEPPF